MKVFKQIICIVLMIVITMCGFLAVMSISIKSSMNVHNIVEALEEVNYYKKTETEIEDTLNDYLPVNRTQSILDEVSVKSQINEIVESFENNTVKEVSGEIEGQMNDIINNNLEDMVIESENAKEFSAMLSDIYVKTLFPVTEMDYLSNALQKYGSKINIAISALVIVAVICFGWLCLWKKNIKWGIIAMYNIWILSIVSYIILYFNKEISIGNIRTSNIISQLITDILNNVLICIFVVLLILIVVNYVAYFKRRRKKNR